jgi:hypothetical protein
VTEQLNLNLAGLRKDGYLLLYSNTIGSNHQDAIYFFSDGDFQSNDDPNLRSNIARIYFGGAKVGTNNNDPNILLLDMLLLTPGNLNSPGPNDDFENISFAQCQTKISQLEDGKDPNDILDYTVSRPTFDANYPDNLLAQRVSDLLIEWTYDSNEWDSTVTGPRKIEWYGQKIPRARGNTFEFTAGYRATWTPYNQANWPDALRFEFTIRDSKNIIKGGRRFEHIVYIGK